MDRLFFDSILLIFVLNLCFALMGLGLTTQKLSRDDFPPKPHFVFGSGTSAFQVEGAEAEDGRTPSIWDGVAQSVKNERGVDCCDGYHKYKEDVQLMVATGLEAYRFSISWSRLIPNGRGSVNPKGLQFYNNFINELVSNGIQPHATLIHYDLPQALEDEYGGWLNGKIVKDFTAYADVCFREFGDRVSYWVTINEANVYALGAYDLGIFPPRRCSAPFGISCKAGNSSTEPYIVAHNALLAHASAARLYKRKYQLTQQGFIGFNIFMYRFVPFTNATKDAIATQRAYDFYVGWFMDPLVFGDYPDVVKRNAGTRIPSFTPEESKLVKGSWDFFGLNHYNTLYVRDDLDRLKMKQRDFSMDMAVKLILDWDGVPPGEFPIDPYGTRICLEYIKQHYGNPPVFIHENGQKTFRNASLNDASRMKYLESYIGSMLEAMRNGSNTKGYFTWSFMDLFELFGGYESSYGLYYVDLDNPNLTRYPKLSAHWYSSFLKGGRTNPREMAVVEKDSFLHSKTSYASYFDQ
ncbi:hypothetical protein Scep_009025 [Stephania cephalantha]|uniref:Beta-glucosidase 11-like n=1 Tax=Stephania cephalantha TaxID=152367 RepID=A0AAP0PDT3_9MAGN